MDPSRNFVTEYGLSKSSEDVSVFLWHLVELHADCDTCRTKIL